MGVVAMITNLLPFLKPILDWWNKRTAAKDAAAQEMQDDLQAHAGDGQASVTARESYEAQVAELKKQMEAKDNGTV